MVANCLRDASRRVPSDALRRTGNALDPRRWSELVRPLPRSVAFAGAGSAGVARRAAREDPRHTTRRSHPARRRVPRRDAHRSLPRRAPPAPRGGDSSEPRGRGARDRALRTARLVRDARKLPPNASTPDRPALATAHAGGIAYEHLTFTSGYAPDRDDPGRERWLAYETNSTTHAWVLRHDETRPWIVCVHGALMGHPMLDLRAFRARWLHHRLGLNVAVLVLPLHGPRSSHRFAGNDFPVTIDPLDTLHGVTQSVWDLRRRSVDTQRHRGTDRAPGDVARWPHRGDHGRVRTRYLACVIAGIPVVDLSELFGGHLPERAMYRGQVRATHRPRRIACFTSFRRWRSRHSCPPIDGSSMRGSVTASSTRGVRCSNSSPIRNDRAPRGIRADTPARSIGADRTGSPRSNTRGS